MARLKAGPTSPLLHWALSLAGRLQVPRPASKGRVYTRLLSSAVHVLRRGLRGRSGARTVGAEFLTPQSTKRGATFTPCLAVTDVVYSLLGVIVLRDATRAHDVSSVWAEGRCPGVWSRVYSGRHGDRSGRFLVVGLSMEI